MPVWWGALESNQASECDGSTIRPVSIAVYRPETDRAERESCAGANPQRKTKRATGWFPQVALVGASSAFSSATGEPPGSDPCYRGRRLRLRRESRWPGTRSMGGWLRSTSSTSATHHRSDPAHAHNRKRRGSLASWRSYVGSRSSWSWLLRTGPWLGLRFLYRLYDTTTHRRFQALSAPMEQTILMKTN